MAIFGRLVDLVGRKRVYVGGLAVSLVASLLAGAAPTLAWLIASLVGGDRHG